MNFDRLHLGGGVVAVALLTGCLGGPGATEVSATEARAQAKQGRIGVEVEPQTGLASAIALFEAGRGCTGTPVGACSIVRCGGSPRLVSAGAIQLDVGAEAIEMPPQTGLYRSDPFRWTLEPMPVHVEGEVVPAFDTEIERQSPIVVTSTSPPIKARALVVPAGAGISIAWAPTNGVVEASMDVPAVSGSVAISCSADGSRGHLDMPADLVARIKAVAASNAPTTVELSLIGSLERNLLVGAWGIAVGSDRFATLDGQQMLVGVSFE